MIAFANDLWNRYLSRIKPYLMKILLSIFFSLLILPCTAQIKLSPADLNNLAALGQLYSYHNMATGAQFAKSADSLRTPVLNHVIDALLATGRQDSSILQKQFMARPDHDELMLWYVIREIHYNRVDTARKKLPPLEVAKNTLSQKINEYWLLDNYYYRINNGLAMLFNTADLSGHNFDLNDMGFNDDTEKGIFFFNMMSSLANGRFRVLRYLKKPEKIITMAHKLPYLNGKPYFYYTNLAFPDFQWTGYDKEESYKQRCVGDLIATLTIQFITLSEAKNTEEARQLYFNSILHQPEYFKYSASKNDLQQLYEKMR